MFTNKKTFCVLLVLGLLFSVFYSSPYSLSLMTGMAKNLPKAYAQTSAIGAMRQLQQLQMQPSSTQNQLSNRLVSTSSNNNMTSASINKTISSASGLSPVPFHFKSVIVHLRSTTNIKNLRLIPSQNFAPLPFLLVRRRFSNRLQLRSRPRSRRSLELGSSIIGCTVTIDSHRHSTLQNLYSSPSPRPR